MHHSGAGINPFLAQLEHDGAHFAASARPPVTHLLYWLARNHRATRAIEVGCHIGYSTIFLAQALADSARLDGIQNPRLDVFDLFVPIEAGASSPHDSAPQPDPFHRVNANIESAGLQHVVRLHRGDSSATIPAVCSAAQPYDFAFIDGDHRIRGINADLRAVDPLLRLGALVVLHDTDPRASEWLGPAQALAQLRAAGSAWSALELPGGDGFGLAILQKTSDGRTALAPPAVPLLLLEKIWNRLCGWKR